MIHTNKTSKERMNYFKGVKPEKTWNFLEALLLLVLGMAVGSGIYQLVSLI